MSYKVSTLNQIEKVTDAERCRGLEETIEILEAQVESLELELYYKNHQLEEMQQLRYTNQELYAATHSEQFTFTQAEELARKFLANEEPLKAALVELLTAIYKVPVKPYDLAQVRRICFTNRYGDELKVDDAI